VPKFGVHYNAVKQTFYTSGVSQTERCQCPNVWKSQSTGGVARKSTCSRGHLSGRTFVWGYLFGGGFVRTPSGSYMGRGSYGIHMGI